MELNMKKYLKRKINGDILIDQNGKIIVKASSPVSDKLSILESLRGIVSNGNISLEAIKNERLYPAEKDVDKMDNK